jgi:hypothetical protein
MLPRCLHFSRFPIYCSPAEINSGLTTCLIAWPNIPEGLMKKGVQVLMEPDILPHLVHSQMQNHCKSHSIMRQLLKKINHPHQITGLRTQITAEYNHFEEYCDLKMDSSDSGSNNY